MRTLLTSSLLLSCALVLGGCAVATDHAADESTEASADSISKHGKAFIATWSDSPAGSTVKFYDTLTLVADGSYSALTSPTCLPGAICPAHIVLEKGRWNVNGRGVLTLTTEFGDKKAFNASVSTDGWELKIGDGAGIEHFRRAARAGEHCGGFVAVPSKCEAGLECFLGHVPDVGGTCQVPAKDGESCGFRVQTRPCVAGDECKHVGGPLDSLTCVAPGSASCASGQHLCPARIDDRGACVPAHCLFAGAMCMTGPAC